LTAYLRKKSQNLATREEFSELEKQTGALTRTTAQIQAEIKGHLLAASFFLPSRVD
jgi:hypothetical protein